MFTETSNCTLREGDSGSAHNVVILLKTGPPKGPEKDAPRRRLTFFFSQLLRRGVHRAAPRAIHAELLPRFTNKKRKTRARPRPIEVSKNPDFLTKQALCNIIIVPTFRLAPARRPRDKTKQEQ